VQSRLSEKEERRAPISEPCAYLISTGAQALCRVLGRRKGDRFLREWAAIVAADQAAETMIPGRSASDHFEEVEARRIGAAWLRDALPHLFTSLPPE
jgi:hypothetical protein